LSATEFFPARSARWQKIYLPPKALAEISG
jgi:hypothetical protein